MPWYISDTNREYEVPDSISQDDHEQVMSYLKNARSSVQDEANNEFANTGQVKIPLDTPIEENTPGMVGMIQGIVSGKISATDVGKGVWEAVTNLHKTLPNWAERVNSQDPQEREQAILEGVTAAAGGGMGTSGAVGGAGTAGMFVGHGLPKEVLEKIVKNTEKKYAGQPLAKDLVKYELWDDYKLFQDRAGDWKTEIGDLPGKFKDDTLLPTLKETGKVFKGKLGDVYQHEELFKQYPDLKNIDVVIHPYQDKVLAGSYWNNKLTLYTDNVNEAQPTILHELQHAIQDKEGWAQGANPEASKDFLLNVLADQKATFSKAFSDRLTELGLDKEFMSFLTNGTIKGSWYDKTSKFINSDLVNDAELLAYFNGIKKTGQIQTKTMQATGNEIYHKSLGEMEARNTEYRAQLEELLNHQAEMHPLDTEDFSGENIWATKP